MRFFIIFNTQNPLMKKIYILLLIFICSKPIAVIAQIDTVFWFAAPWVTPDSHWRDPIKLQVAASNTMTTVRVRQPQSVFDTTFILAPNGIFDLSLFHIGIDSIETKKADTVLRTGFKITSSSPISAAYIHTSRPAAYYNSESFSLKGQNAMGKTFYIPAQKTTTNQTMVTDLNGDLVITQGKQQFNIVACEDNAIVWITPACNIVGHIANVSYSISLPQKGKTYTAQNVTMATNTPTSNMGGTYVSCNKNISITVADDNVKGLAGCFDLIGDQIVPISALGSNYILCRNPANANEEYVYLVGTANSTTVSINNGVVTTYTLNAGTVQAVTITANNNYISSTSPIYAYHLTAFGCEKSSDLLIPLNCSGSNDLKFIREKNQRFVLNIVAPTLSTGSFSLNGNNALVPASAFTIVPGTGGIWSAATIEYTLVQIPQFSANNIINSNSPFILGVLEGAASTGSYFHYLAKFNTAPSISMSPSLGICTSGSIQINSITAATSFTWLPASGLNSVNIQNPIANPSVTTTYTLLAADISNCSSAAQITINVSAQPTVSISGGTLVCSGQSVVLTATGASTYSWSNGGLLNVISPSPSISITYSVIGTTGGCSNQSQISVSVNPSPSVSISGPTVLCIGETVTLTANGANTYSWISGPTTNTIAVSPTVTSNFMLTGASANSCSNNAAFTVSVNLCTGITNNEEDLSIKIYPNPNSGNFIIESNHEQKINITNILGEVLLEVQLVKGINPININSFSKGIYFISNDKIKIKLVKE